MRRLRWIAAGLLCCAFGPEAGADEFEQIDGRALLAVFADPGARAVRAISLPEIAAMPALLRDTRSALVLARTERGNPARMLVVPELRRPASGQGDPIPVMVLERVDSFDAAEPGMRLAHARDVVLFDGFRVDLDTGHIVPEGQGEDLVFRSGAEGGPRLEVVGPAKLFVVEKPPMTASPDRTRPTPGRVVVPRDFGGRYRLYANGQWSGSLDLVVDAQGVATGHFVSDLNGSRYPVTGQTVADHPGKILFAVSVPRARLEFDGLMFGEGKGAMAGTVSLIDRTFGFFAVREGGRLSPAGPDVAPLPSEEENDAVGRHRVVVDGETLSLDGKKVEAQGLSDALRALTASEPDLWVSIEAGPEQAFAKVSRVIDDVRRAGIATIRMRTKPADPDH